MNRSLVSTGVNNEFVKREVQRGIVSSVVLYTGTQETVANNTLVQRVRTLKIEIPSTWLCHIATTC